MRDALYACPRCLRRGSATRGRGFAFIGYAAPSPEKHVGDDGTPDVEPYDSCAVTTTPLSCLPDEDDLDAWIPALRGVSLSDPSLRPFWLEYLKLAQGLTGTQDGRPLFTYLGGHPAWVNGLGWPDIGGSHCTCGQRLEQVLQLDTEEDAGFSFGKGAGFLNLFQCPAFAAHADVADDGLPDDAFRLEQQYV